MKSAWQWAASVLVTAVAAPAFAQEQPGSQRAEGTEYEITDFVHGTAYAVHESSYDVQPQIQLPPDTPHPKIIPIRKFHVPKDPDDFRPSPRKYVGFEGTGQTPWSPPDPTLAVGPGHVVETVNMNVAWWDKAGNLQFSQRLDGDTGFFSSVGAGGFTFDPKCFYHEGFDRYFVLALEVYGNDEAYITFALSDDNDPNGTWYKYRTDAVYTVSGQTYWWDYPGLGYDDEAIYITGNLFGLSAGGFAGAAFRTLDISSIISGGPASYSTTRDGGAASVQVAHVHGGSQGGYMVSTRNSTSLRVHSIINPLTSPVLSSTTVGVSSYSSPPDAPNNGGNVDTLDGRIMNVEYRGTRMVAGHGIDGGSNVVSRWYEIDTNNWPASGSIGLAQEGEVDLGSSIYTFFPALAINADGDIGLISARSASSEFASVIFTRQQAGAAAGTMETPVLARAGEAAGSGRWGDYFDCCVDPTDDLTFWGIGEYYRSGGGWGTWIQEFEFGVLTGFYFSVKENGTIGGVTADDADILHHDGGVVSKYFDYSDVNGPNADVNSFEIMPDGSILISFVATENIAGLIGGPNGDEVRDEDMVRFIPATLGEDTTGTWEFYFDGSDVGLGDSGHKDIDAIGYDEVTDTLHLSFQGPWDLGGGFLGKDEDIVEFTATSLGATTAGSFTMLLDGNHSNVKLGSFGEDIDAYHYRDFGFLTVSTTGDFRVPRGQRGQDNDLAQFQATTLGTSPVGTWVLLFDGASIEPTMDIDGLHYINN